MKRYAIFGGSFDPLHLGHLGLARAAVREAGLDQLIFMPNYISPFKTDRKVTDPDRRCAMLETILKEDPAFLLSRHECDQEGPSYTIDTLTYMREHVEGELSFVLGFDSVMTLDTWYQGPEIIRTTPLITARRPDTSESEGMAKIDFYRKTYDARILVLDAPPMDYSSTEIRRRAAEGRPITGLVPPQIEEYIISNGLYTD